MLPKRKQSKRKCTGVDKRRKSRRTTCGQSPRGVEPAGRESQSEVIDILSHKLGTPLACVKGFLSLVLEGEAGELNAKQVEYLGVVRRNVEHLQRIASDLLEMSRLDAGKVKLKRQEVDVRGLVKRAVSKLEPQAASWNITLSARLAAGLPQAYADRVRADQILENLIENALRFTPEGGSVRVAAREGKGEVEIVVEDSGPGIPSENLDSIFARFTRLEVPGPARESGTGLGLAIARKLVEVHGGKIWVVSEEGKGSMFYFTLPAVGHRRGLGQEKRRRPAKMRRG